MNDQPKAPPFWYAIGGFIVVPIFAIILVIGGIITGVALLAAWPAIPLVLYRQRCREQQAEESAKIVTFNGGAN